MSRQHWSPETLLPKAELLAFFLTLNKHVTGVALTGSLARFEPRVHDIDLVVFHDGQLPEGGCRVPETANGLGHDVSLSAVLGAELARRLATVREEVPISYLFVREQALWDCDVLQALKPKEKFPGLYLTIFCQIPFLLLSPDLSRGGIRQFIEEIEPVILQEAKEEGKISYSGIPIRHRCGDPRCKPEKTWEEVWLEIRDRKEDPNRIYTDGSGES